MLAILIHLGYLAYDEYMEEVYIPNEEVRKAFTGAVEGTDWTPVIDSLPHCQVVNLIFLAYIFILWNNISKKFLLERSISK